MTQLRTDAATIAINLTRYRSIHGRMERRTLISYAALGIMPRRTGSEEQDVGGKPLDGPGAQDKTKASEVCREEEERDEIQASPTGHLAIVHLHAPMVPLRRPMERPRLVRRRWPRCAATPQSLRAPPDR